MHILIAALPLRPATCTLLRIAPRRLLLHAIVGIACLASSVRLHAQEPEDDVVPLDSILAIRAEPATARLDVMSVGAEVVASPGGGGFFSEYRKLGGTVDAPGAYVAPSLAARLELARAFRLVVRTAYAHIGFIDIYNATRSPLATPDQQGEALASIVEDFSMRAIPLLAGVEYSPIQSQFSSYVGVLGGVAVISGTWQTTSRPVSPGEFYRPTINVTEVSVAPVFRAYTGVDLRFDRYLFGGTAVRGIFLEAGYLVLPASRKFFAEIRHQAKGLPLLPTSDESTLNIGGFTVTLGINLQFRRR